MLTGDMLRRAARRFPSKPAVLWEGTSVSYRAYNASANQFAHALRALGLAKGAKVGIVCRNRPEYGIAFFGTAKSGCILVNVSVLYSEDEMEYVLGKADVEAIVYEDLFAAVVEPVAERLPKIKHRIVVGQPAPGATAFEDFLDRQPLDEPGVKLSEDDPFCMTYTGGTTGRPKGVLCTHRARAITAHTVMVEERLDERDVVGVVTPMFHVAALNIMFQPAVLAGATVTMLSKWDVNDFREMARETGMTANFFVPTQAGQVVQDPDFDPAAYATWRKASFAGAPMPDWVQVELGNKLPDLALTQIYGQSEMGVICVLPAWKLAEKLGSVGREAYNVDMAVVHPDGTPVKPGEVGEVVSRGDNLMLEYYDEPEQTAEFFRLGDGWGWSGDMATIDDEGYVRLVDRSKEMLISGGENIYPSEIERVIYELDEVSECAVFGIPHDKWGEVPAAYISLKAGENLSEAAVTEHCAAKLARFKRPQLIRFVDDFPKTAIGKIQKTVLKDAYWAETGRKI